MSIDSVTGGGTAERTLQISREMSKSGIETTILTTDIGLTRENIRSITGIKIIALPCLVERLYFPKFSYSFIQGLVKDADINYEVWRNRFDAREDEKDMKCFHKADGKKVWFSNHFTIMKEEIADVKETK